MKPSTIVALLALAMGTLDGCSQSIDCSGGAFRGGCVAGGPVPAVVSPPVAAPVAAIPNVAVARPAPAPVSRGEPAEFADVDDKQCRSYGLTFGGRDYADCRLRLSAQHRGLDPNVSTTTPASGVR
jgi:hypothetical protein